jgi:hypothetical protein
MNPVHTLVFLRYLAAVIRILNDCNSLIIHNELGRCRKERLLPVSSYSAGIEMDRLNETKISATIFESGPPKCKDGEHFAS